MKLKATIEVCDNPDCLNDFIIGADKEPAPGYHFGKGFWILGGGGPIRAFYACTKECVIPALDRVIEESF
jgi:hypothetical protein